MSPGSDGTQRGKRFPKLSGFMFDVDGTLLLSDRSLGGYEALPGAAETLDALAARGVPYVLLTNGSAYPPAEQAGKLRKLGLAVTDQQLDAAMADLGDATARLGGDVDRHRPHADGDQCSRCERRQRALMRAGTWHAGIVVAIRSHKDRSCESRRVRRTAAP